MAFPTLLILLAQPVPAPESAPPELAAVPLQDDAAAAEEEKLDVWTGAVNVSGSFTDGNTDIQRASVGADATRKSEGDRWTLGFLWSWAEEDGDVTQRRTRGAAQYDYFLTEKSYLLAQASAENDSEAGLDLRWIAGVGYGRQFRDDDKWKLSGEAGLSYFSEEFDDGTDSEYLAARLAYGAEWHLSETWSFAQDGEAYPSLEDKEDIYTRLDTRAQAKLTESMVGQLQWVWDWDNTPAAGKERSDHLVLLGVGWTF